MTRWPEKLCAQLDIVWAFIRRAVGNKLRSVSLPSPSPGRTSISVGAPGRPMIRDSCATEISVGDGMASTSSSRAWTRYSAAASRGHRGNPQNDMTYRNSVDVNPAQMRLTEAARSAVFNAWGLCDPPTRRHAQVSRPVFSRGRIMSSYTSISPDKLARLIGTAKTPALIDVRTDEDFAADPRLIPGAVRRNHQKAADWGEEFSGRLGRRRLPARRRSSHRAPRRGCGTSTSPPRRSMAASKAGRPPSCRWCRRRNCRRATRKDAPSGSPARDRRSIASPAPG